jgi:hypothetical protein
MLVMFRNSTYIIMEKNESIEHVLDNMEPKIVYKKKSSALTSLLLIAISIVSFITYTSFEWQTSDTLPHLLFIFGFTFLTIGVLLFFFRKIHYVSLERHQKLKTSELYFDVKEQSKLVALIESGSLNEIKNLKPSVSSGLRLRVLATRDGDLCLSQVIAYISNESVNINSPKIHSLSEAQQLKAILHK